MGRTHEDTTGDWPLMGDPGLAGVEAAGSVRIDGLASGAEVIVNQPEPCPDCRREVAHEPHDWPFTIDGVKGYTVHCPGWSADPKTPPLPPEGEWPYLGQAWFEGVGTNAREKALFIVGHLQGRSMHGERAFLVQSIDEASAALLVALTRYGWSVAPYSYGNDPGGPGNTTTYKVFQD